MIANKWFTDPIPLSHSVRQGDSLSPMLYILYAECLTCKIHWCCEIEDFLLHGAKRLHNVGVYTDDTTSLVKSVYSLTALLNVIRIYERVSGARLNVSKTEPMWLGEWCSCTDQPFGLTWVSKTRNVALRLVTVSLPLVNTCLLCCSIFRYKISIHENVWDMVYSRIDVY